MVETASQGDLRRETRIKTVSVALQCENPMQYNKLYNPLAGKCFHDACSFIGTLADAGVKVGCTAVDRTEVNIAATRALALALGAASLRSRPCFTI